LGLPGFLREPIGPGEAREKIAARLRRRDESFLLLARQGIYDNPASPYLKLLEEAGCSYGDLARGIAGEGLEGMLLKLKQAGVWLSPDEFKGRVPIRRGSLEFHPSPDDFENCHLGKGLFVSTGGSTGRPVKTKLDLDFLAARAVYDRVAMEMLDLDGVPLILWYPSLPASTGIGNSLRYAKAGKVPVRWFNMLGGDLAECNLESRVAAGLIVRLSRLCGTPLPIPEAMALDMVEPVAEQILALLEEHGRCAFQSYVSQALRVAGVLQARRRNLEGLLMIVGSEPLTRAKRGLLEAGGASIYHRYFATEAGSIGMGCGNPAAVDELHLMSDMIAAVQDAELTGPLGGPLYLTTLNRVMPRIMLNVQLGDMALLGTRNCGCEFEKLGFHTHLSMVRSYTRYTGEGMAVASTSLERIIEEVIAPRYGGTPLDYQLVEHENDRGRTQLKLRVSPVVGVVDEERMIRDILSELKREGEGELIMAAILGQSSAFTVSRELPQATERGKYAPMLKE